MSEQFVPVARADAVKPGQTKRVIINNDSIPVANVEGAFHAVDDMCIHQDFSR